MATVRASCPTCGDVETTTQAVQVLRCADTGLGSYAFVCPGCRMRVAKPAVERVMEMLVDAGVRVRTWALPLELREYREGPAVSHDDLLAFHCALDQPGWLEEQVSALRPLQA